MYIIYTYKNYYIYHCAFIVGKGLLLLKNNKIYLHPYHKCNVKLFFYWDKNTTDYPIAKHGLAITIYCLANRLNLWQHKG